MTEASSLNTLSSSEPWSRRLAPTAKQKNRHNLFLWNNKKFVKLSNLLILVYIIWQKKHEEANHTYNLLSEISLQLCCTFTYRNTYFDSSWCYVAHFDEFFFTCTHVQSMHMPLWNINLGFYSTKYILNDYQKNILIFIAEFTFQIK